MARQRPHETRSEWARHRLTLVVDPRFPGGTSTAVAAEIRVLAPVFDLEVVALETAMFRGRTVHPAIMAALEARGRQLVWSPPVIRGDTIVVHNPSCLRFDRSLPVRMSCRQAFVVTHENFARPTGVPGFDVAGCLGLLEDALVTGQRRLAPVSAANRRTVESWLGDTAGGWRLTGDDWCSVIDLPLVPPTDRPRDRRGRHSRPGPEKFPPLATLRRHFPPTAEACIIMGADLLLRDRETVARHWDLRLLGATPVDEFLGEIDFFVYFTHPLWRESFGRVIAEAIAAGKVVITDPATAESFGEAVVASDGSDVDAVIAAFVAEPALYVAFVQRAQASLARFSPAAMVARVQSEISSVSADALV